MKYRTRTYYTATQKALMWERWKDGWTLHQIGKLFDRPHTSIHNILAKTGERQTRYVMLVKLDGKDSQTVVNALIKNARKLPQELYKSLTWDRGTAMHGHKRFTMATDIKVYFCDPQSPWQRGSNENTNGLLSQYLLRASTSRATHGFSSTRSPDN
jgi:IS30 family transposase